MYESKDERFFCLSHDAQAALVEGARDAEPVRGLTHGFYKYPARFSPAFARAAIETFTKPGDLVLDPHVGGGTSLVEARRVGARGVGVDISPLAEFVASVKCTVFSEAELDTLEGVGGASASVRRYSRPSVEFVRLCRAGVLQAPRPSVALAAAKGN